MNKRLEIDSSIKGKCFNVKWKRDASDYADHASAELYIYDSNNTLLSNPFSTWGKTETKTINIPANASYILFNAISRRWYL
jgi:hypothetical protein